MLTISNQPVFNTAIIICCPSLFMCFVPCLVLPCFPLLSPSCSFSSSADHKDRKYLASLSCDLCIFWPHLDGALARSATVAQLNKAPHNRIRNLPVKRHQATKKKKRKKISQLLARRAELCGQARWCVGGRGSVLL